MTHPNPSSAPEGVIPALDAMALEAAQAAAEIADDKAYRAAPAGSGVAIAHEYGRIAAVEAGIAAYLRAADRSSRAEGVGAEQLQKAWHATEARRSDIQGFYRRDDNSHYIRDLGLRRGEDVLWSESGEYEPTHAAMMERIELEQFRIVSASLSAIVPAPVRDGAPTHWHNGMGQLLTAEAKQEHMAFEPDVHWASQFDQPLYATPLPNPEADQLREALRPLADLEIPEGKFRVADQTEAYFPIRFSEIENARAALTKETTNAQ